MTSIRYEDLMTGVSNRTRLPTEQADQAARATLRTLAERLPESDAERLASRLPPELAAIARVRHPGQAFDLEEFRRRVGDRERTTVPEAEQHARAVLVELASVLERSVLADVLSGLPEEYRLLFESHEPVVRERTEAWSLGGRGDDLGPPPAPGER